MAGNQRLDVREYIGARYVPMFYDDGTGSAEWSSAVEYEPLTIVLHEGNSYTSRQYVPAGIQITNTDYWLETGNWNSQVESYRQEVLQFSEAIDNAQNTADEAERKADSAQQDITTLQGDLGDLETELTEVGTVANNANETAENNKSDIEQINESINKIGNNQGFLAASRFEGWDTWRLFYTPDSVHFYTISKLEMMVSGDDLCNLRKFGDWYYLISQHVYKSKDLKNWERANSFPTNPYGNYRTWGYEVVETPSGYEYIFCPAIDNTTTITNGLGTSSYVFHVFHGSCTFNNDTGEFTFGAPTLLPQFGNTNSYSYIDPSLVYHPSMGYVLAIKNEKNSVIEVWVGASLEALTKQNYGVAIVGSEAPKVVISSDNEIMLFAHAYSGFGTTQTTGIAGNIFNYVQTITRNYSVISNSYIKVIESEMCVRHLGVMKCDAGTYKLLSDIGIYPHPTYKYRRTYTQTDILPIGVAGNLTEINIPDMPNSCVLFGGSSNKTFNAYKVTNDETLIPILKTSGANIHAAAGTGFRTGIVGKQTKDCNDGETAGMIVCSDTWSMFY